MVARRVGQGNDDFLNMKKIEFREGRRTAARDGDIRSCEYRPLIFLREPIEDLNMLEFFEIRAHIGIQVSEHHDPFDIEMSCIFHDFSKNRSRSLTATKDEDVFFISAPMDTTRSI